MKLKTFLPIFLIVVAIGIGGGLYAWSLATPPERTLPTTTVSVDTGEAWLQKKGQGEWVAIGTETPVTSGDHVKTGEKSAAHVDFFDGATARLDENAEIVVTNATVDEDNTAHQETGVTVLAGRVWSRVLKFVDKESAYTAEMSDVVATVRGTTFVMDATDPAGWLVRTLDSTVAVRVAGDGENEQLVTTGEEAWVPKTVVTPDVSPRRMTRRKTDTKVTANSWFAQNKQSDTAFVQRVREKRLKELRQSGGVLPGSPFYGLKRLGEKLRVALTADGSARRDLSLRYADRRFAEMVTLMVEGRRDVAKRLVVDFHRRYLALLGDIRDKKVDDAERLKLCRRLRGRFLEQDVRFRDMDDATYPTLFEQVDGKDPSLKVLPRVLWQQACGEAMKLPAVQDVPPERVIDGASTSTTPLQNTTSTKTGTNTNGNTNTPVGQKTLVKITLVGQRTILSLPDSQQLKAVASFSDGSTKDITAEANWSVTDAAIFSDAGGLVLTKAVGSAAALASLNGVTGSFGIRVIPGSPANVTLQGITVVCSPGVLSANNPLILVPLQSSNCTVTAQYSDETTKNVTGQSTFSVPQTFGTMQGSMFTSNGQKGKALITAKYTEGQTVQGTGTVTVQ